MQIVLSFFSELTIFMALIIVGLIIILLLKAVVQLIIPIVAAAVAWFLTHSLIYAGIAFLAFAVLQLILKRK